MLELDPKTPLAEFRSFLERSGIPYKAWPETPGAKTVEQLWEEMASGESRIQYEEDGDKIVNIERHVNSVLLDVRCFPGPDSMLGLHADGKYLGGEEPLRHNIAVTGKISTDQQTAVKECLLEKLGFEGRFIFTTPRTGESPVTAARRCLEASPSNAASFIVVKGRFDPMEESSTFPGITSLRDLCQLLCVIPLQAYRPDQTIKREHIGIEIVCKWQEISKDDTDMSLVRML